MGPSAKVPSRKLVLALLSLPPLPRAHVCIVEQTWEAIIGVSAAWRPLPMRWGERLANKRLIELQKLAVWLLTSCCSQGTGATLGWLKRAAAGARDTAITGVPLAPESRYLVRKLLIGDVSRDALDQLAFLGRTLPPGDKVIRSRALVAHRAALTSSPTVAPALRDSARRFATWFARAHIKKADLVESVFPSPSASADTGRKDGGSREETRRQHIRWISELPEEYWSRPNALSFMDYNDFFLPSEVESVRSNQGSVDVARAAAWKTATQPATHRVTCVPERGWKQRIVSAPPAHVAVAGSVLNKALLKAVARYRPASDFLRGDRREAMGNVMQGSRAGQHIVSTDLSAATDRFPLDLVRSVVLGLCDGWIDLPPLWSEALFALTGEQGLAYPWGQEVQSSCGILMGLGPSWPILSVIHAWWAETSFATVGLNPRFQLNTFCIGGDDLFARWPRDVVESYRLIVTACNGKRSAGKDFLSITGGNFTEISIFVSGSNDKWRWSRAIPVKGLVGASISEIGASYESLSSDSGRAAKGRTVIKTLHPDAWKVCRDVGIAPDLPRSLGGAGLPPIRGSLQRIDIPLRQRLALGRFLYGAGQSTVPLGPPSWVEAGDPAVWQARKHAEGRLTGSLELGLLRYITVDGSLDPKDRRRKLVVDHLADQMSYFARTRVFSETPFPSVATEVVSLRKYSRLVNGWIAKKTKGGVPSRMALTNRVNSRSRLLTRARENRGRWALQLAEGIPDDESNHRPIL